MFERDQARRWARRMYRNWLKALALLVKIRAQRDEARAELEELRDIGCTHDDGFPE